MTISRVLVANRGEIARRLIRGLSRLGYETVAVYSDADRNAPHVSLADFAVPLGGITPSESYLRTERILEACRETGAHAVHPGYGFLSENSEFAAAVEDAGRVFIGPRPESIRTMGDKTEALSIAREAGVPTIPSYTPPSTSVSAEEMEKQATALGLPLMIKAAAGGGGKGMRIARETAELSELIPAAIREAENAFGDGRIFLERYLNPARHVEVQVLGDGEGKGVAFGERDCSIQRRHQKLIEEAPAPGLSDATRAKLHAAAVGLVESTRYRGVGTVEFIFGPDESFFFLEMNTRLQVEHPVTECVFGIDLLQVQMEVAEGRGIPAAVQNLEPKGHSIEVRVYAEDATVGFLPTVGELLEVIWPDGPGVRVDSGVERGHEVTVHYDPMLAKIIVTAPDRERAIDSLRQALGETFVAGVRTTIGFCRAVIDHPAFREAKLSTGFIPDHFEDYREIVDRGAVTGTSGTGTTDAETSNTADSALAAVRALAPRLLSNRGSHGPGTEASLPLAWENLSGWRLA